MKKRWMLPLLCLALLAGCAPSGEESGPQEALAFQAGQLYAVAYLGYQEIDAQAYAAEGSLDLDQLPVHYLSGGDWYLVIPRYQGMELSLYQNDLETMQSTLIYRDPDCQPFLLQCNVSDIFPDATIRLSYQGESMEFSPFLSLRDGALEIGERGLDITQTGT
jgi:hypothetical protein